MSLKTLPILFLNLGGEMVYILDQRLRAQNIPDEKAKKVMHDILCTMLNQRFMLELFKPQDAYSKKAMRIVFDRLAHASIMRLNAASMDKLYDLMTMALKYQVSLINHPSDVLMGTLNHMDTIREFAQGNDSILQQVECVFSLIKENYCELGPGEFHMIRQTLLSFFQDMHIRVSIFLKHGVQTPNGHFVLPHGGKVPWGFDTPGAIKFYDELGREKGIASFEVPDQYQLADKLGSFELLGDRVTKLGCNMYNTSKVGDATLGTSDDSSATGSGAAKVSSEGSDDLAKAGLDLLDYLIQGSKTKDQMQDFRLNLFETDADEEVAETEYAKTRQNEVLFDASQRNHGKEITALMNEFTVESTDTGEGDNLLDLMDSMS